MPGQEAARERLAIDLPAGTAERYRASGRALLAQGAPRELPPVLVERRESGRVVAPGDGRLGGGEQADLGLEIGGRRGRLRPRGTCRGGRRRSRRRRSFDGRGDRRRLGGHHRNRLAGTSIAPGSSTTEPRPSMPRWVSRYPPAAANSRMKGMDDLTMADQLEPTSLAAPPPTTTAVPIRAAIFARTRARSSGVGSWALRPLSSNSRAKGSITSSPLRGSARRPPRTAVERRAVARGRC